MHAAWFILLHGNSLVKTECLDSLFDSLYSVSSGSGKGGDSRKKATLKKCIHELRSLMMPQSSGTSDSSNTVHTLQKVLKEMKKIKGMY